LFGISNILLVLTVNFSVNNQLLSDWLNLMLYT